jgi:U3 small nucleolar RNA-associated protein 7
MVGNLAPPSKLTVTTFDGKPPVEVPYARLPRIERLRVSGKIDETEDNSEDEGGEEGKKLSREEREKRKTRGKGKSLKRYLRKQRKNVIDPAAVCFFSSTKISLTFLPQVAIRAKLEKQKEEKKRAAAAAAGDSGENKKSSALDRFKQTK